MLEESAATLTSRYDLRRQNAKERAGQFLSRKPNLVMTPLELLREQFNHHVQLQEKRPGVLQLSAPLFHEDGDTIDVFLDLPKDASVDNKIKIILIRYPVKTGIV